MLYNVGDGSGLILTIVLHCTTTIAKNCMRLKYKVQYNHIISIFIGIFEKKLENLFALN